MPTEHLWWDDRASEAAAVVDQLLDDLGATVDHILDDQRRQPRKHRSYKRVRIMHTQ
ncbi:hypothetical protein [Streptomyces sp. NPDC058632]|uniref:hypothetical protein n=1 Tax=unclassified Streptomyces TaxID=2593676 RepID=UPI00364C3D3B